MLKIRGYRGSLIILVDILDVTGSIVRFNQVFVTWRDSNHPLSELPCLFLTLISIFNLAIICISTCSLSFVRGNCSREGKNSPKTNMASEEESETDLTLIISFHRR